ncbi:MAG: 1,4-alpha-glucan branching protein GlgB [Chloroflexota bacterium]
MTTTSPDSLTAIVGGHHSAPFDVLGIHPTPQGMAVRTFQPQAKEVAVLCNGESHVMERVQADGFFEAVFSDRSEVFRYRLKIALHDGHTDEIEDPYRFPPVLSEDDLYLFNEGTHLKLYEKLGAQIVELEGVRGVAFSVWAPNAERVSVVGGFNGWDGRRHPMRPRGASGVWELFIPGLAEGELYKYEIKTRYLGYVALKCDPFGFASEVRPNTASIVTDLHRLEWRDDEWMSSRKDRQGLQSPISVYEVHLGSWRRDGERYLTYRELAETLVPYAKEQGFTHLELLPVTEHPFDGSWGYQTIGYFAPTSRFGSPADFAYFVDAAHRAGLGVIVDWVPAHFPKDQPGLSFFDGTHLYEHADPRLGEHQDWGTLIFNFGRSEVAEFLLNSALFWLDTYHIDGLRVDAVASMLYLDYSRKEGEWLPNKFGGRENLEAVAFIKRFNELVHLNYPDVLTFAEESTAWPMVSRPTYLGGLGFDLKWNMGWMHDMLEYMSKDPIHRRHHHNSLTFSLLYAFTENFILPLSHDEVVHGKRALLAKMPGDYWQQFANLRALYSYMFAHPGKKLLFMGDEFGQWNEWNSNTGLDWILLDFDSHRGVLACVRDLNRLYVAEPALHAQDFSWEGFEWIDFRDVDGSAVSFTRRGKSKDVAIIVVANFTPVPRMGYRVGVPAPGHYREIFNSDSTYYGGSNVGNIGGLTTDEEPWQGQPCSVIMTLPPLAVVYLKKE